MTPSVKRTPTTESPVELESEKTSNAQNNCGKTVAHVPGASRRHVQREGNSKKNYMSNRERRDEFEAFCEIPERRSECKEPDRIITPPKFVNVYTDDDWAGQATTCRGTSGGVVQWGNATLTAWSQTQQTVSLSSAEAELYALTTGVAEGMVTKHIFCKNWDMKKFS